MSGTLIDILSIPPIILLVAVEQCSSLYFSLVLSYVRFYMVGILVPSASYFKVLARQYR